MSTSTIIVIEDGLVRAYQRGTDDTTWIIDYDTQETPNSDDRIADVGGRYAAVYQLSDSASTRIDQIEHDAVALMEEAHA